MNNPPWRPSATLEVLQQRGDLLASVRQFFAERSVLEVETPLLARYSVTDPHMDVLTVDCPVGQGQRYFLQTSPEYAMKRLLAAGSGPIYQLSKAFRKGEQGSRHNPEFTMLEWYRPGFDHIQLMDEVEALVVSVLDCQLGFERLSYREVFLQSFSVDPHSADASLLEKLARERLDIQMQSDDRDDWLNLLLAECIEPDLGKGTPVFIYDYPATQAALAQVGRDQSGTLVANRFELYINGIELANGYLELTDAQEQRRRFRRDQQLRQRLNKQEVEEDTLLLAAMDSGLPDCAGVALGFDRLAMLVLGENSIAGVQSFTIDRA